mmetsp:Transcript_89047/g.178047  ORF Transcript_89047/g.178047 Transcript_89047/m.178047 type:complete len:108 (-) Transcript_89047:243-566(-)
MYPPEGKEKAKGAAKARVTQISEMKSEVAMLVDAEVQEFRPKSSGARPRPAGFRLPSTTTGGLATVAALSAGLPRAPLRLVRRRQLWVNLESAAKVTLLQTTKHLFL